MRHVADGVCCCWPLGWRQPRQRYHHHRMRSAVAFARSNHYCHRVVGWSAADVPVRDSAAGLAFRRPGATRRHRGRTPMILLYGIPTEAPLALTHERLAAAGEEVIVLNQRHVHTNRIAFEVTDSGVVGELAADGRAYDLDLIRSVYLRPVDQRGLPELADQPDGSPLRARAQAFHQAFIAWTETTDALVVNRFSRQASNGSKPYQAQVIRRFGFAVPETLITNDTELVRAFAREHRKVVYKSTSGIR